MPLAELGFVDEGGRPDGQRLVEVGPTIEVVVSSLAVTGGAAHASEAARALVDTRSTLNCISKELAKGLSLTEIDKVMLSGVAGDREHAVYAAQVDIPSLAVGGRGEFAGVDVAGADGPYGIVLGRTFLRGTILIYDGIRAQVTLASMWRGG